MEASGKDNDTLKGNVTMPTPQPKPKIITLEQYEALPEDTRAEVFEGDIVNVQYSFDSTIKVNIYNDLLINFSDITELLNI